MAVTVHPISVEPAASPRRKRRSHVKTKTGCLTCKIRRKKCDETRPSCVRCTSTGRKCDGYPLESPITSDGTGLSAEAVALARQPVRSLSPKLFMTREEGECFQFFQERTGRDFSGYFDTTFWINYLPKLCHAEPTIRHAVVALGAVHRRYEMGLEDLASDSFKYHHLALFQYTKAVGALGRMLAAEGTYNFEVSMISSILFASFETFQGNYHLAIAHLKAGLKIMNSHQPRKLQSSSQRTYSCLSGKGLEHLFARLEIQALTFLDTAPSMEMGDDEDDHHEMPEFPEEFTSLEHARDALFTLAKWIFILSRRKHQSLSPQAKQESLEAILRWSSLFTRFLKQHEKELNITQVRGAILLKIYRETAIVVLLSEFWTNEDCADELEAHFVRIVVLSESLVDSPGASHFDHPIFTLEMGVVPPLYLAALKCRSLELRYQAMSLLQKANRREGMWDGIGAYRIAERVIAIEEEAVVASGLIREKVKIQDVDVTVFLEGRKILMQYSQRAEGAVICKEEWISW